MKFNFDKIRMPYREDKVFGILSLLFLVVPLAFSVVTYENFETIKYFFWLVLIAWGCIVFLKNRKIKIIDKKILWTLLVIGVLAFFSTLGSLDRLNSLFGFYYRFTGSLLFIFLWLVLIFLLFQTLNKEKFIFLVKILVFDALLISLVGFAQSMEIAFYGGSDVVGGFIRAPSLLGNPNFSTMFLVSSVPFAAILWLKGKTLTAKLYYGVTLFFAIIVSFILSSRGALLALLGSLAVVIVLSLWFKFSKKLLFKIIVFTGIFLAIGIIFLQVSRPGTIGSALNYSDENVSLRLQVWNQTIYNLKDNPLLGTGPGTFHILFSRTRGTELAGQRGIFDDAHNLYLNLAATFGIPFLAAFLLIIFFGFYFGIQKLRQSPDYFALASIAALSALLISASFNPVPIPMYMFSALLVAGLSLNLVKDKELEIPKWISVSGIILGMLVILFGFAFIIGEHLFFYSYRQYFQNDYKAGKKYTAMALQINPTNELYFLYNIGSKIRLGEASEQVIPEIEKMKRMHPNQNSSFVKASNLYYLLYQQTGKRKFLEKAVLELEISLKMDPLFAERYGQLGFYLYELGKLNLSEQSLKTGLVLKSEFFPSWLLLAKVYQLQDNREKSMFALEKAYKLRPDLPQVKYMWRIAQFEKDIQKVPIQIFVAQGRLE